jgi:pimeloyl-ACP methyl ester carboxylesterase
MRRALLVSLAVLALAAAPPRASAQGSLPRAIITDPPRDSAHPARMAVLHIPSGGGRLNAVAYVPPGAGKHPLFVFFHGLPGNEKNLDLVQAVRRAGWVAVAPNYRGSWGSPGTFSFAGNLEDADAVLAHLRTPAVADSLGIDTTRIVIAGHSMGGWVTVNTASRDHGLAGAVLISAADMGGAATSLSREQLVALMADNMESLAGVTAESMATGLTGIAERTSFASQAAGLARTPLLVITSDDGLAPGSASLVEVVRGERNVQVTTRHFSTDHSYSDARIALQSAVIRWLQALATTRP